MTNTLRAQIQLKFHTGLLTSMSKRDFLPTWTRIWLPRELADLGLVEPTLNGEVMQLLNKSKCCSKKGDERWALIIILITQWSSKDRPTDWDNSKYHSRPHETADTMKDEGQCSATFPNDGVCIHIDSYEGDLLFKSGFHWTLLWSWTWRYECLLWRCSKSLKLQQNNVKNWTIKF